jgi:hypothetical protein
VPLDDLAITGRAYLWRPKGPNEPFMEGAQAIIGAIHDSIVTSLRYAVSYEPSTIPPMPPKSDLQAVCNWHQIYAPAKPLQQLAQEIGVSYSHLRNTRNTLGLTRQVIRAREPTPAGRPARGKARRNTAQG